MKPSDFVSKYYGQIVDYDSAYSVQCVDAFKVFCKWAGIPVKATPNNWANGYWIYRDSLGYSQWFDYITDPKDVRDGDWCVWDKGSSCPPSHIAMYYKGQFFGERQGGNNGFISVPLEMDIMGALRWKGWNKAVDDFRYGLNYRNFEDADLVIFKAYDGYGLYFLSAGEGVVKDIQDFDNEHLLIAAATNANYFQMQTGQADRYGTHYGVEQTYDGVDLAPKKEGLLAYFDSINSGIEVAHSSGYWLSRDEVRWACTPYSVVRHRGVSVNLRSTDLGNKEGEKNTQTMIARVNDHWFFILCRSKVLPSVMARYAEQLGADEAMLMDSGGSSQLMAWDGKKYSPEIYTGRHIPNVFVIAKEKPAQYEPVDEHDPGEVEEPTPEPDEPVQGGNDEEDEMNEVTKTLLPDKAYDVLKWVSMILLPALTAFVLFMGTDLSPSYELIAKWITGIATLLGSLIGVSTVQYNSARRNDE